MKREIRPSGLSRRRQRRLGLSTEVRASSASEVQRRAEGVEKFLGGPASLFETRGRIVFISLIRRGLQPDSVVFDVGCGALRAGYWLIHFLDRGCYYGIEPAQKMLEAARAEILEAGLEDSKQPTFANNGDFDLSVFGVTPDFVLLRSVWSHASKNQIVALLDSLVNVAGPDTLLLTSYLPARSITLGWRAQNLAIRAWRRLLGRRHVGETVPRRPPQDYQRDRWANEVIAHDFHWIADACAQRGLVAVESPDDRFGVQVWLEIRRVPATGYVDDASRLTVEG